MDKPVNTPGPRGAVRPAGLPPTLDPRSAAVLREIV